MIYVVHEYDMIFFVGINWKAARDAAIREDVDIVDVWKHGKYSHSVDLDGKQIWPEPKKKAAMSFQEKLERYGDRD